MSARVADRRRTEDEDERRSAETRKSMMGVCGWRPDFLQRFSKLPYFLFVMCLNGAIQGSVVNGFISTSISSIEKRFNLNSTQSGFFAAFYDIAIALSYIPLSYYAHRVHKMRWMGIGMIGVGLGSLLIVVPHFIGTYQATTFSGTQLCVVTENGDKASECSPAVNFNTLGYLILLLSQLLTGLGAGPLFTYGYSMIDELDGQKRTARNYAIVMATNAIAPALGFVVGGQLLRVWGDFGRTRPEDQGITGPADPRWYGAWWIGFGVCGALGLITALPFFCFPRRLADTDKRKAEDQDQTDATFSRNVANLEGESETKVYFRKLLLIVTTGSTGYLILMQTVESLLMNAYITFIPKVFENLFGYTSSWAASVTGLIVVPMAVIGNILGSWLDGRFGGTFRRQMTVCIWLSSISVLFSFVLLVRCPERQIAGLTAPYFDESNVLLTAKCNTECGGCDGKFGPVCLKSKDLSFLSACHAGCQNAHRNNSIFTQCSCAPEQELIKGFCKNACGWREPFFLALFSLFVVVVMASMPLVQTAGMRATGPLLRDAYLCLGWLIMRVGGSIPGAIFFGRVIDGTCNHWQLDCKGNETKCLVYDTRQLGFALFLFTLVMKILALICYVFSRRAYRSPSGPRPQVYEPTSTPEKG